jgi:hypothetical protein
MWFKKSINDDSLPQNSLENPLPEVKQASPATSVTTQGQNVQSKQSQTEIHKEKVVPHPFGSHIRQNSGSLNRGHLLNNSSRSGRLLPAATGSSPTAFRFSDSSKLGSYVVDSKTGLRHRRPNRESVHS